MPNYNYLKKFFPILTKEEGVLNKEAAALLQKEGAQLDNPSLAEQLKGIEIPEERGFQLVGEPQERGFTLGESGPISRPPVPFEPEVISGVPAKIPSRDIDLSKVIDITPEQSPSLNNVNIPSSAAERYKYLKNIGLIGAAGAAGTVAMNSGDGSEKMMAGSPVSTEQPNIQKALEIKEPETEVEKALKAQIAHLSKISGSPSQKAEPSIIDFGQGESIASLDRLKAFQEKMNEARQINNWARLSTALASGMGGTKDRFEGLHEGQDKAIDAASKQYGEQVAFEKEDPNSPQSKGYRSLAKAMGFDIKGVASAADIEKQFPQLANIYNQREAQAARKEMARERLEQAKLGLAAQKDSKLDQQKNKFIEYGQKALTKEFAKYQTLENSFNALEQASGDKVGASDVAILYNFIKALDPNSVVREGEIALGQRGMSLGGRMYASTLGQFSGEMMDPKFRSDVLKIAGRLKDQGYTSYNQTAQVIRDTAKQRYGMNEQELGLIDPLLNREQKQKQQMDKSRMPVSDQTKQLISSRSDDQNRKRLEELERKYGKH